MRQIACHLVPGRIVSALAKDLNQEVTPGSFRVPFLKDFFRNFCLAVGASGKNALCAHSNGLGSELGLAQNGLLGTRVANIGQLVKVCRIRCSLILPCVCLERWCLHGARALLRCCSGRCARRAFGRRLCAVVCLHAWAAGLFFLLLGLVPRGLFYIFIFIL